MTKCRECGFPTSEHCTRWDCPDFPWLPVPIPDAPQHLVVRQLAQKIPIPPLRAEATCQQGAPCGDPDNCPDPVGCGFVDAPKEAAAAMHSPLDWDYADLKRRMQALKAPPFMAGSPGIHCPHCPLEEAERCVVNCAQVYRDRYGVEPQ